MKARVEYIDSMRGVAMLMVVIFHVSYGCFHSENIITSVSCAQFQLPLFFMVSGFFAGKIVENTFVKVLKDKFCTLVVPALLMLLLYCMTMNIPYLSALKKMLKDGYWFTLVLYEFVVIFAFSALITKKIRFSKKHIDYFHLSIGIAMIYIAALGENYNSKFQFLNVITVTYFGLYFYYVMGYLVFKKKELVCKLLADNGLLIGGGYFNVYST